MVIWTLLGALLRIISSIKVMKVGSEIMVDTITPDINNKTTHNICNTRVQLLNLLKITKTLLLTMAKSKETFIYNIKLERIISMETNFIRWTTLSLDSMMKLTTLRKWVKPR